MALREFLEKRFPRLRHRLLSGQESSLYANATTTCKVCGAPLRGDEAKCPYCGTAVREGELKIKYAKVKESKVKMVKNIIERHFPGRVVSEVHDAIECEWWISCAREKGKKEGLGIFMPDTCFAVKGDVEDEWWGDLDVYSYNPHYDSGAEAVAKELKLYTNVNLFLSGGKYSPWRAARLSRPADTLRVRSQLRCETGSVSEEKQGR